MQTIARSMADTGSIEGRYMPHAPPIVGRYGKRPDSRMRLQLRTVHDLISSPRAFAGRAAPKEIRIRSADVIAWRAAHHAVFDRLVAILSGVFSLLLATVTAARRGLSYGARAAAYSPQSFMNRMKRASSPSFSHSIRPVFLFVLVANFWAME